MSVRIAAGMFVLAGCLVGLASIAPVLTGVPETSMAAPYKNCTQARGDGVCNIPSDSDKYQAKLDRDQDGIGCEC